MILSVAMQEEMGMQFVHVHVFHPELECLILLGYQVLLDYTPNRQFWIYHKRYLLAKPVVMIRVDLVLLGSVVYPISGKFLHIVLWYVILLSPKTLFLVLINQIAGEFQIWCKNKTPFCNTGKHGKLWPVLKHVSV